ncbi:hypothetical protein HOK51_03025 [Candidatus Woesearchaeota archaeon]|nr:hypothetical protein [Candidatus Woesearchaeota archaeon]MBT6518791.1 hypothetical protein [Candidatus Woesearchaeota archaeon]MBT7367930.1 hypothetical protein [Candidatus Woesearchaeota archaeon]
MVIDDYLGKWLKESIDLKYDLNSAKLDGGRFGDDKDSRFYKRQYANSMMRKGYRPGLSTAKSAFDLTDEELDFVGICTWNKNPFSDDEKLF